MRHFLALRGKQLLRIAAVLVISGLVVGCGFALRGQLELPASMKTMRVAAADPTTRFYQELIGQLQANGVVVSAQGGPESMTLVIDSQRVYREPLTISQDARVREYVLYFEVRYGLQDRFGEEVLANQSIRLSREYQFDEQAILGGRREEEFLEQDLSRQMAAQLVRQLSARSAALSKTSQ